MSAHACGTHSPYQLSCRDYEALHERAGDVCEHCNSRADLQIDHDHALGVNAVRGLLCGPCNRALAMIETNGLPSGAFLGYLERAWHIGRVVEFVEDRRAPVRSVVIDAELWLAAQTKAKECRTTVSQIMRSALVSYVERYATDEEREQAATESA